MTAPREPTPDVAIIGAGPAGLSAAAAAAAAGADVLLIDDNATPGGQYYRLAAPPLRAIAPRQFDEAESGADILSVVDHPRVTYVAGAVLHGVFEDGIVSYVIDGRVHAARPRSIVVATGATERPMPFPGWTLPGVMGAGAAQNLMKSQRMVPGRRVLVAGNGPLMLLAAANLVRLGVAVVAVVESAAPARPWRHLHRLCLEPGILARGFGYRVRLAMGGVPVLAGHVIVAARGGDRVEEADVAPIRPDGVLDRSRIRTFAVDSLVVGYGLIPVNEVTRAIGCAHVFEAGKGGWIPSRSADLETTRSGVFAAGECAGVAGMEKARLEGRLAGLAAAARAGRGNDAATRRAMRRLRARLARLGRFRRAIEALFVPPVHYLSVVTDDTVVCRCEEVQAGDVRVHLADGLAEPNMLKAATRMGLGRCQGRNCLATQAAMIAAAKGISVGDVPWARPRPPMRPVPMGALVDGPAGDGMSLDKR